MKKDDILLSEDKKTLKFRGQAGRIYTIAVGGNYERKDKSGGATTVLEILEPRGELSWQFVIQSRGIRGNVRAPTSVAIAAMLTGYVLPTEQDVINPPMSRKVPGSDVRDFDLAAKLVVQLVADVADLRARMSALEKAR